MKKLCSLGIALLLMFTVCFSASAEETSVPYDNYTYSADGSVIVSPQAYLPDTVLYGHDFGINDFSNATDIDCDSEGNLYILDEGNCRVAVFDSNLQFKRVISLKATLKDGTEITLNKAQGITVTEDKIYICDTENSRVLLYDKKDGKYITMITTPESVALEEDFVFKPIKASIDDEGNYYIVSNGTYEGVINLDINGEFLGFFAANEATATSWELFWRRFSTVEQRKKSIQFVPQDLSSIDMDSAGFFLITTATAQDNAMIKRVNPGGNNIIRNVTSLSLIGDISKPSKGNNTGESSFIDVSSGPYKIYACLDSTRGKIFCYNNDGYLLYTFGGISDKTGGFTTPAAVTYLNDERIAVLDNRTNSVTVFSPTDYAKTINKAISLCNDLKYDEALGYWEEVLKYNQNYEFAQNMIANSYYSEGKYEEAMQYFKEAGNKEMYSTVKQTVRSNWIYKYIKYIIAAVAVIIVISLAVKLLKLIKSRKSSPKGRGV